MTTGADVLEGLNPAQREAVESIDGPLLIIAGPGSGKTRVITHRIAYLVRVCGVSPYSILAMTFTNKAAREMRSRLERLVGGRNDSLTVGTFHGFCAQLLRRDGHYLGLASNYSIYDVDDQVSTIKQAMAMAELDPKSHPHNSVRGVISRAKNLLWDSQTLARNADGYFEEACARVYRHYEEMLARNNAVDFDDLLLKAVLLLDGFPEVQKRYQDRYTYLLVDEFQDTNVAQYRLARLLTGGQRNICVVGDPDQSIYSWRSADIRNILSFQQDYPSARTISLEQNYRSTSTILETAKNLISANGQRLQKDLFTDNVKGDLVEVHEAYDETDEAAYVVAEISRLVRADGFNLGECAVMYRVNAQSRALEEACLHQGMKYRLVGGVRFYQRREIKDLAAYLRLIHNPQDDINLARVINVPARGIGAKSMRQLGSWAEYLGVPLFEALTRIAAARAAGEPWPAGLPARAATSMADFADMINRLVRISQEAPVVRLLDLVLDESGLRKSIQNSDDRPEERWQNILEFRDTAQEFNAETPPNGLATLLERTALVADVDSYEDAADSITLITLHQAKGLEFPVVFIAGLEEGLLPHSRSVESEDQLEEERRLCYVGVTRAEKRLYLSRAFRRRGFTGNTQASPASRFLRDIPPELIAAGSAAAAPAARSTPTISWETEVAARLPARPTLKTGDLVRHTTFGEGVVTAYEATVADVEVTVEFSNGVGVKRLLLSFAPLEKVTE